MPHLIAAVVTFFTVTITVSAEYYAIAVAVATAFNAVVASFILGKISQAFMGRPAATGGPPPQTIQARGTLQPRRIIYGQVRTTGTVNFFGTSSSSGTQQDYLWWVITLAGHQLEEITDVWFDSTKITNAQINASTGAVTGGVYAGKAYIWRMFGPHNEAVQADWNAAFAAIGTDHKGIGVAKLIIRLSRDADVYPNGSPQTFSALVKGKRVYDPRLDTSAGGSGSHRTNDATTWAWSDNPALCAADYLMGGSLYFSTATPIPRLGMNVPAARINWPFLAAAANECEEAVNIPGSTTQARYSVGAVLSCGNVHDVNMDILLSSMLGQRVFTQGKYRVYAGAYDSPAATIDDGDLGAEGYTVQGATPGTDLFNTVAGMYFDPLRDWQNMPCAVRSDTAYIADDDGKTLLRNVDLSGTTDEYRAQRICEVIKRQSRNQIVVTLNLKLSAVKIAPWETFYLTLIEQGWVQKVFRAQKIEIDLAQRRVVLTAREEGSGPYADPNVGDYATATTAAPGSTVEEPSAPSALSAGGTNNGIILNWTKSAYFPPGSTYDLYEYTSNTPFGSATLIRSGLSTTTILLDKSDQTTRYYWVRAHGPHGQLSDQYPSGNGVAGAAAQITTVWIADEAVSQVVSNSSTGTVTAGYPLAGTVTDTDILSATITTTGGAIAIDATGDCYVNTAGVGTTLGQCDFTVRRGSTDVGSALSNFQPAWAASNNFVRQQVTLTVTDNPGAGTYTYYFHNKGYANGAAGSAGFGCVRPAIKIREYKK